MGQISWDDRKAIYTPEYFDDSNGGGFNRQWWEQVEVWGPRARVVWEAFHPSSALVCGCAKGSLVKFLEAIYGVDAYGFDLSDYAISSCPYPEINQRLLVLDAALRSWPYDTDSMDICTCFDFLEHNPEEFIPHIIGELKRITCNYILIRSPLLSVSTEVAKKIFGRTAGFPYDKRVEIVKMMGQHKEWSPDANNIEHPNNKKREDWVSLFAPEFSEVFLDSYYYDIKMGVIWPVIPFYDTIVLRRV